jgi:hypothetical protein
MSSTARVLLVVFGSLAALLVVMVSLLVYSGYRMASSASDPATIKRVAAEFGTFDVPPGYRETMAMDVLFSKSLIISRVHQTGRDGFTIILGRTKMPGVASTSTSMKKLSSAFESPMPIKIPGCKRLASASPEPIRSKGGTVTLRRSICDDAALDIETASAFFSSNGGIVFVTASGTKASFDLPALRSLIASFR